MLASSVWRRAVKSAGFGKCRSSWVVWFVGSSRKAVGEREVCVERGR